MNDDLTKMIIDKAKKKLKNGEIKSGTDVENFMGDLFQPLLQGLLNAELDNMLDYERYSHNSGSDNSRNGFCKEKKVKTRYGSVNIKTPRDRKGKFEPVVIPKGANDLGQWEEIILSLCAKGMSYRDISSILKEMYGVGISKDQVAKFADTITAEVEKWFSRPLKSFYAFTYADCLYIPVMNELKSEKKAFYVIIGVDINGMKDILGIWCDKTESATFWTSVFEDIKARGVEDILFTTSDGVAGFQGSLETVFPKTQAQRCVVHLARNLHQICPKKQAGLIMQDFKRIYSASCLEVAQLELENFKKKFANLPKVVSKVEDYMQYIEPLFELPDEIRKAIYTSNSIESVNSALRKVTNGKGSFSSEESVYKVLYLRIRELKKKWSRPIPNWNIISSQLAELFGERYTKYLEI